jgi:DNA-binding NarL/FixJ family response regulator
MRHAWEMRLTVVAEFADLAQAWERVAVVGQASQADNQTNAASQPALWLMRLNTLDDAACAQLASVRAAHPQTACVLLYSYGPQTVVQALRRMGCVVRREPLQDDELAELIQAVLTRAQAAGTDAKRLKGSAPDAAPVPPRKYADHTLQRVASLSGTIQCECPRHVAELIAQLANFEQYSQACLNKSPDDARLHAHLNRVSGTARALFEQALEMVARHEGIDLA